MSSRTRLIVSYVLFATTALLILTGPGPAAVVRYFAGKGNGPGSPIGHRELLFSLASDALAWLTCLSICVLIGRLAHRLRDRVPFSLTTYILGVFLLCFGLLRAVGYATLWSPLAGRGRELLTVRAAASVVVAMGVAVLFPYAKSMIGMLVSADKDHEKFVVAAESSLDAFYIMESVRDEKKDIVDFRAIRN